MATMTVKVGERLVKVSFALGRSVREILDGTTYRVRSGCRGIGACGLCRIRINSGAATEPTANEKVYLTRSELAQGIRLACQTMPESDMEIEILAPAQESPWRTPTERAIRPVKPFTAIATQDTPNGVKTPLGVAVDLGTTHISMSLYDLHTGEFLTERYGPNPQHVFGSDVVTRLMAAVESEDNARLLRSQVVRAIGEGLWDIAHREGIDTGQVVRFAIVGNTAMLALLSGRNYDLLLQPKYWTNPIDCIPDQKDLWSVGWGIHPNAMIQVIPPLAGFVGSDLLAGLLCVQLARNGGSSLLIDFGTNSEMALWNGDDLWVSSAAGGPAFEGSGISCGLPVGPGAITRVTLLNDGIFQVSVINDETPQGICGSGVVDLISNLVQSGRLSNVGRFTSPDFRNRFTVVSGDRDIVLTKGDVDVFQRAKAAIGAGIEIMLAQAGEKLSDLKRVFIGGAFGRYLNVANAQAIGLLPTIEPSGVELNGNTALAGCEVALLSTDAQKRLERLRDSARIINLANCPDFEEAFLKHLYLQPSQ